MSNTYHIGQLFTPPIQDHAAQDFEIGNFEVEVRLEIGRLTADSDKLGLIKKTIGQHLAVAMMSTQVPAEMWRFQPSERAKKDFNLTSINFGAMP